MSAGAFLRKLFIVFCLFVLLLLPGFSSGAAAPASPSSPTIRHWYFNGPFGGPVNVFASDSVVGMVTYAGGQGGIWKTTDGGEHWQYLYGSPGMVRLMVVDPVHPANVYAANETKIYKSANGGISWSMVFHVPHGDPSFYHTDDVTGLVIDPLGPDALYVSTANAGLFRSANGGLTWTDLHSKYMAPVSDMLGFRSLTIDPFIPSTLYSGKYRSLDGGLNFSEVNGPGYVVYAEPDAQNILYSPSYFWGYSGVGSFCLGTWSQFYKSITGGNMWGDIGPSAAFWPSCNSVWPPPNYLDTYSVVAHQCMGYSVLISAGNASYYGSGGYPTTDGGVYRIQNLSWSKINNGLGNGWHRLAGGPLGLFCATGGAFVGMDSGVYRTNNANTLPVTWAARNQGLSNAVVTSLGIAPDTWHTVYAGTVAQGIYKSIDNGMTWISANNGIRTKDQQAIVGSDKHQVFGIAGDAAGHVYAATNNGLYYSWNFGTTWTPTAVLGATSVVLDPTHLNTAYTYGLECSSPTTCTGKVYVTTDAGQTWIGVVSPDSHSPVNRLAFGPAGTFFYALGSTDGLYVTSAGALGWAQLTNTAFCKALTPCTALAVDIRIPGRIYIGSQVGLWVSIDGGKNWTVTAFSGQNVSGLFVDPTNSTLYAAVNNATEFSTGDGGVSYDYRSGGVFQSSDAGLTWTNLNLPADRSVNAVVLDPIWDNLYAGMQGLGVGTGKKLPFSSYVPSLKR